MPRILVLHASVGTGHKSAATALGAAFARKSGMDVRVADTFEYSNALFSTTYTNVYLQLSNKAPLLWRLLYENLDTDDLDLAMISNRLRGLVERPLVSELDKLVRNFAPDAIVCTHPLPIEVLQRLKLDGRLRAPIFCVITDFVAHSVWIMAGIDGYFLASDLTRDELIARGVAPNILYVKGIPVNPDLSLPKDVTEMRQKHNLPLDRPVVTLFGGGLDPERAERMVSRLLDSTQSSLLVAVAGRSQPVIDALNHLNDGPEMQLRRLGFIDYVDDLVAASDLVITKAGGLIVSEILARGIPMVLIDPIPGQEEWNADYVVSTGAGIQVRMIESVPTAVSHLLSRPHRLETMREYARDAGRPRAALDIAEHILDALASGLFK